MVFGSIRKDRNRVKATGETNDLGLNEEILLLEDKK